MERFKTIDDSIVTQKENNPSLAKDEKDRNARDDSTALNCVPQLVGGRYILNINLSRTKLICSYFFEI